MRIEICDICKEIPKFALQEVKMAHFTAEEDFLGKPQKKITICLDCFGKIFPPYR